MRKLGLDLGAKSLGVALSDKLCITAQGKENFKFEEDQDFSEAIAKIKTYLDKYEIDVIVLGYPLRMTGTKSETTYMVEHFKELLLANFDLPVVYIDERETSKKAHQVMIDAGVQRKKRKNHVDKIAAQLILQDYLMTL